ncbi:hypothetical protein H5410_000411 [Solanum commersonii]|uniref:Uncharacterized protein n=1 Tax=Solanum commersonii TaxID=4109 RepID=A0A9J6AVY7_SOLCO|nr:hypothetical protein H5410_000411 [Solanum commersonii]
MKEQMAILGNNRIEDVRWLCSLTESELDLLIGLKVLIQQRAKKIGHKSLANKFDLKTLRALSEFLLPLHKLVTFIHYLNGASSINWYLL